MYICIYKLSGYKKKNIDPKYKWQSETYFKESLSKPRHRQFWLMMVDDLWLTFPHLNWCFAIMFGLNPPILVWNSMYLLVDIPLKKVFHWWVQGCIQKNAAILGFEFWGSHTSHLFQGDITVLQLSCVCVSYMEVSWKGGNTPKSSMLIYPLVI